MVIIGGGALGASTAYFLSLLDPDRPVVVAERDTPPPSDSGVLRMYSAPDGTRYWCLSSKYPLYSGSALVGLFGLSRDLPLPNERHRNYYRLSKFLKFIDRHFDERTPISHAAKAASLSMDTLARLTQEVYHLTPGQLLMKRRIDHACWLLEHSRMPVAGIATACGYSDQSAFTRKFKTVTRVTPMQYRAVHENGQARPSSKRQRREKIER